MYPNQEEEQEPQTPQKRMKTTKKLFIGIGILTAIVCGGIVLAAIVSGTDKTAKPNDISSVVASSANKAAESIKPTAIGPVKPSVVKITKEGTFIVPNEVKAGTYQTTVPQDSIACYWERLTSLDGSVDSIADNGFAERGQQVIVTVSPNDKYFKTTGCGVWTKIK